MKRRDFFEKSGCGLLGMMMAYFGLISCKKEEEAPVAEAPIVAKAPEEEISRKDMIKKMKSVGVGYSSGGKKDE
jgi:hypothetical protein